MDGGTWIDFAGFGHNGAVDLEVDQIRKHGDQEVELSLFNLGTGDIQRNQVF